MLKEQINIFIIYHPYTVSAVLILGNIFLGFLIEKFFIYFSKVVNKFTSFSFYNLISMSIKNIVVIYMSLYGIYKASLRSQLKIETINLLSQIFNVISIIIFILLAMRLIINYIHLKSQVKGGNNSRAKNFSNTSILDNIIKILAFIIGAVIILGKLGVSITPIITALGVGGIAVALALQDILSNLFSGVYVLISSQIKTGDYIKLPVQNIGGTVIDITWRTTLIKTSYNEFIYIPNSLISSSIVDNYTQTTEGYLFDIPIIITYDSDLEKAEEVIFETAVNVLQNTDLSYESFEPIVRFKEFGTYGIKVSAVLKCNKYSSLFYIKHKFIKELSKNFKKENIKIAHLNSDFTLNNN